MDTVAIGSFKVLTLASGNLGSITRPSKYLFMVLSAIYDISQFRTHTFALYNRKPIFDRSNIFSVLDFECEHLGNWSKKP